MSASLVRETGSQVFTTSMSRSVTLTDPFDLLSVETLSEGVGGINAIFRFPVELTE